ncbi:MAG: hypothetical protein ACI84K_001459 [Pseudohongiellaceae bacterium]|jgi:hypothetical protein
MFMNKKFALSTLALSIALAGCGSDNKTNHPPVVELTVPETYSFISQFEDFVDVSSVSYSGQIARQVLIADIKSLVSSTELANIDDRQEALDLLNSIYDKGEDGVSDIDGTDYTFSKTGTLLTPGPTYGDISTGKDIKGKMAGEDNDLRHGELKGWATGLDVTPTPDEFVQYLFGLLADNVVNQTTRMNPIDNETVLAPYVMENGVDLQQLIQKFLVMGVAYSQGTGDYLADDLGGGKGIFSSAEQKVKDGVSSAYSSLEHSWDEGYGYFGAARDFNAYTDLEIRAKDGRAEYNQGFHDLNGDGLIDLNSEINFAASVNAAKRDVGSAESAPTDFTKTTFDAFLTGRALITQQTAGYEDALVIQRDIIVNNWEKTYAATIVHYINDVLQDMGKFETGDYSFTGHAKHWSEMKGFALGLQFNPNALMSIDNVIAVNDLFGEQPVLPTASDDAIAQYKADLLSARDTMQQAYNFSAANMGDENGENGW